MAPPRNPPPVQLAIPLEPLPAELVRQARQWWQERPWWRQRYARLEDLLACPERRALVLGCARMAVLAGRRRTTNT